MRLTGLYRRVRALLRSEEIHGEIDEEMRFHIDMRAEENVRRGMTLEQARLDAERRFGGLVRARELGYEVRGGRWLETLWRDCRYGARSLRKSPGFTTAALVTLALGIGANTAIFSVVNALVLSPPRVAEPERVVAIWRTPKDRRSESYFSYLGLEDLRTQLRSFESVAGYKPNGFTLLADGQAERVPGMRVTANFMSLVKVGLLRGRDFLPEEERRGAPPVVIVSERFWRNRLGRDEGALGRQLTLSGKPFTVVGVLPAGFEFPLVGGEIDLVATVAGEGGNLEERGAQVLRAVGRLRPGVAPEQAQTELTAAAANLEQQYPQHNRDATVYLVPLGEQVVGPEVRRALWLLLGAVGFLLLIACTNVTNLMLARAGTRQRELALRAALGASRWRIACHMLSESLLLASAAGCAGLLTAAWGLGAIRYYGAGQLPRIEEVRIDTRVLAFTLAASALTAVVFSLLPILKASRPDLNEALKAGSKTGTTGGSAPLWRDLLVVAEVALGLMLLVGAGLMMRSFGRVVGVDPGFDPENVLTGQISLTRPAYEGHDERANYVEQTLERLKALPGVEGAAFVAPMPFSGGNVSGDFRIEGRPAPEPGREPAASVRSVTPQYFQSLRIPLRSGRHFTEQDRRGGVGTAIINEALAARYFPGEDPVGKYVSQIGANQNEGDPERWEIVGIVGDVRHSSLTRPPAPELYLPYHQNSWTWGNFFVRTANDPASLSRAFADAVRAADKTVLVTKVQPLEEAISETVAQPRFYALLFTLFGAAGLLLMLTGVYGVISYTVTQHTQEIGVRMALGAQPADVLRLFLGRGMLLTSAGIVVGVLGALALARLMNSLLFGVSPSDPLTFTLIPLLLTAVSLLACYVPARRATKVDPLIALRAE